MFKIESLAALIAPLFAVSTSVLPRTGGGYQVGDGNTSEVDLFTSPEPAATKTAAATLTMAELTSGIIPATSSGSYSLTTMTGVEIDAYLSNAKIGSSFNLAIVAQTATNVITLAGGAGVTVVGLATVTGIGSASFMFRKTGTGTWSAYRL